MAQVMASTLSTPPLATTMLPHASLAGNSAVAPAASIAKEVFSEAASLTKSASGSFAAWKVVLISGGSLLVVGVVAVVVALAVILIVRRINSKPTKWEKLSNDNNPSEKEIEAAAPLQEVERSAPESRPSAPAPEECDDHHTSAEFEEPRTETPAEEEAEAEEWYSRLEKCRSVFDSPLLVRQPTAKIKQLQDIVFAIKETPAKETEQQDSA